MRLSEPARLRGQPAIRAEEKAMEVEQPRASNAEAVRALVGCGALQKRKAEPPNSLITYS